MLSLLFRVQIRTLSQENLEALDKEMFMPVLSTYLVKAN